MAGCARNLSIWNVKQEDQELKTVLGCIGTVGLPGLHDTLSPKDTDD